MQALSMSDPSTRCAIWLPLVCAYPGTAVDLILVHLILVMNLLSQERSLDHSVYAQSHCNRSHLLHSLLVQCFSAVVGPNGSGKSNVIDAMLFVFGRRAKQVRDVASICHGLSPL
jgi:hypothetical protein